MKNISRNPTFMNLVAEGTCFTRHEISDGAWNDKCGIQFDFFNNNVLIVITSPGKLAKTELCLEAKDAKDFARYLLEFADQVDERYKEWRQNR